MAPGSSLTGVPVLTPLRTNPENASLTTGPTPGSPEYKAVVQARDLSPQALPQTVLVLLTLVLIGVCTYLVVHFWKKNRHRRIPTLYKLEGYRYSRLNQNELDVDSSVVYYRDALEEVQSELDIPQTAAIDNECKPATLHVETNSLVNTSNCTRSTTGKEEPLMTFQIGGGKLVTLEEASDEDLLQ